MKKTCLMLAFVAQAFLAYCQPTTGMLGHWNMDGTANDVSGGGLNGHGNNLSPAVGTDGVMGHGWYFNGTNSSITIPYASSLNLSAGFTIAAVLKIGGFYTGPCHGNTIFMRGKSNARPGSYFLQFTDYPAGYGCTPTLDTNQQSFLPAAVNTSGISFNGPPFTGYDQTPHIISDKWYNVVATFNGTDFKVYIDDSLKTNVVSATPGAAMGTSTDSAAIGYAPYDGGIGYPYWFKGIMDDIKLYDHALTPCEVSKLTFWSSTLITANPVNDTTPIAGVATYSISDTGVPGTYQWQQKTVSTWTNVPAAAPYSGVNTKVLTVNPVTVAMSNYKYRCIRTSGSGCVDTSGEATQIIGTTKVRSYSRANVSIVPNPAKSEISVTAPMAIEKIEVFNMIGQRLTSENPGKTMTVVNIESLAPGMYLLKLNDGYTAKFVKE